MQPPEQQQQHFDIQTDEDLRSVGPGLPRLFINNGTVSKSIGTGAGTTAIQAHPFNFGTVEVLTGTLSIVR